MLSKGTAIDTDFFRPIKSISLQAITLFLLFVAGLWIVYHKNQFSYTFYTRPRNKKIPYVPIFPSLLIQIESWTKMSQQFCLRWNNHQHNLLSVFEDLLHHEAFVDVTLACDGLQLKAHKMVLSACSPYFQSMLYGTPDRHPIVFLRDVRYHEMKALLEFMYRGEVSVDQDNLSSLLKVAEGLKIKGLADVNEQKNQQQQAAMAGLLTLQQSSGAAHLFPGLLSPSNKRSASPPPPTSSAAAALVAATNYLGPKRKRGRPRRLSGSEAVPLASGLVDNTANEDLHVQTEDIATKLKEEKVKLLMLSLIIIFSCAVSTYFCFSNY